jgi:hypothetical protein
VIIYVIGYKLLSHKCFGELKKLYLSRSNRLYSMLLSVEHFISALHNQSPLVHGWWAGATMKPLLHPRSCNPLPSIIILKVSTFQSFLQILFA